MSYLYITDSTVTIGINSNTVEVRYKDGMVRSVPVETLESINIFGHAQITVQCTIECLKRGVPVNYYSKNGHYFGKLQSTGHVHVERQRKQEGISRNDVGFCLAKKVVRSKIHNQQVVLKRYANSRKADLREESLALSNTVNKIDGCRDIQQLMGYEGIAARCYFRGLSKVVEPEFSFNGRSRRPPKDSFNSMLSLGYSIIMNEIYGKIESRGLNPYFGFLHRDHENHPTLASDLMEEWRAVLVDSMVMSLVNGHEISMEHFYSDMDEPGVFLTKDGMKVFLNKMEHKLGQESRYLDYVEYPVSFRRALDLQTKALSDAIMNDNPELYHPIWIR